MSQPLLEDMRPINVRAYPNPFEPGYNAVDAMHGVTVGGIVRSLFPPESHRIVMPHVRAWIGGHEVLQPFFDLVKPRQGQTVVVKLQPAQGLMESGVIGKPQIATGLSIVTSAGALILGNVIGGPAGIAAQIAFGILGVLVASAIVPPPTAPLEEVNNTVSNFRNRLEAGGILPQTFGLMRVWPKHGARPYTRVDGNTQELRAIFAIGQGEYKLSEFKIGDTDIAKFDGVTMNIRAGGTYPEQSYLQPQAIYSQDVNQIVIDAELPADPAIADPTASDWIERTTSDGVMLITVAVAFPDGLYRHTDFGPQFHSVDFEVEFKRTGTVIDDDGPWTAVASRRDVIGVGGYDDLTNSFIFGWLEDCRTELSDAFDAIELIDVGDRILTLKLFIAIGNMMNWINFRSLTVATTSGAQETTLAGIRTLVADYVTLQATFTIGELNERVASFTDQIDIVNNIAEAIQCLFEVNNYVLQEQNTNLYSFPWWIRFVLVQQDLDFINYRYPSGNWRVSRAERGIARAERSWVVAEGEYDVRIRRVSNESPDQSTIHEKAVWATLSGTLPQAAMPAQGVAAIEISVTATDQLSGFLESFSCLAFSILPVWDEVQSDYVDWPKATTSNPAWIYCAVLMGPTARNPLDQDSVDMVRMKTWADYCDLKQLQFNATFTRDQTVFDALKSIATVGRARPILRDGQWSVAIDMPLSGPPVQVITPRNSWGFTAARALRDLPHGIKVNYNDATLDYSPATRVVYNDGFDESNATVFETMTAFGVTNSDQAWNMGRYFYRAAVLRSEIIEINLDIENIVCEVGDLVRVGHWVNLWGSGQGRIKTLIGGGPYTGVTVDDAFPMESGKDYAVRGRQADGTIFLANVNTVAGDQTTLTFESSQTGIAVGDLLAYGEQNLETQSCIVHSIRSQPKEAARLTLVAHYPGT